MDGGYHPTLGFLCYVSLEGMSTKDSLGIGCDQPAESVNLAY